jgi:hypothetical protein
MKKNISLFLLIFFSSICIRSNSQGFATSNTNWSLPAGGYYDQSAHNYGFFHLNETGSPDLNCLGWTTMDMNGDGNPDLVVTSQGDGTHRNSFGLPSGPYWKVYLNTGSTYSLSATNWTLPTGGYVDQAGHNYGFFSTACDGSTDLNCLGWSSIDMNGDNRPDLVVTSQGDGTYGNSFGLSTSPYWKVYLNNGSGFATSATNWSLPSGGYVDSQAHNYGFFNIATSGSTELNCLGWSTIDMNDDGRPDLVVTSQGDGTYGNSFNVSTSPHWKVYLNNGSGMATSATNWNLPTGGYVDSQAHNYGFFNTATSGSTSLNCLGWSTMDMNGDGKPDLIVTSQGDGTYGNSFGISSSPYWKVYLNTGSAMSSSSTNWNLPSGGYVDWQGHNYGFFNTATAGSTDNNCNGWSTVDINGDTKPDLIVVSQGDGTYGNSFNVSTSPHWKVYYNTGSGMSTSVTNWTCPSGGYVDQGGHNYGFFSIANNGSFDLGCNGWSVADMNGDGKLDLVVTSQGTGTHVDGFNVGNSPYWKVYLNTTSAGIAQAENKTASISIYPNPFATTITINSANEKKSQIDIYNTLDELVYQLKNQSEVTEIDLSPFPDGIYLVRVSNEDGVQTMKIIKQ